MKRLALIAAFLAAFALPASAQFKGAGGFGTPGFTSPAAVGGGGFSLTLQGTASSTTSATTISYGTVTYGSGCTRVVAVILYRIGASTAISSVTVNGSSLSQVSGAFGFNNSSNNSDVWESSGAISGSSGTVSITYAASTAGFSAVGLYCLNTTTPTASAATQSGSSFATSTTATITIPASGGGVVGYFNDSATALSGETNWSIDATVPNTYVAYFGHTTATGASLSIVSTVGSAAPLQQSVAAWGP